MDTKLAHPFLCSCVYVCLQRNAMSDPDPCLVILKTGDNLQCDVACLSSFHLMNAIWRRAKLKANGSYVEAKVYQTVSFGNDIGLLEFVPGCISLNELKPQDLAVRLFTGFCLIRNTPTI